MLQNWLPFLWFPSQRGPLPRLNNILVARYGTASSFNVDIRYAILVIHFIHVTRIKSPFTLKTLHHIPNQ